MKMTSFSRRYMIATLIRNNHRNKFIAKRKHLRNITDVFDVPDEQFRHLFRLPKDICRSFITEVSHYMDTKLRNTRLSKKLRILVALRFFAQGSYQQSVGQDFMLNVSQPTVSRCVREVCSIMDRYLLAKYVRFPRNNEEVSGVKENRFYEKFNFPGIIGAIDGTHIKIKGPDAEIEHVYVCRKGGHSINVQAVCDFSLRIIDCNARFGGTAHDASVWRASALRVFLQQKYSSGERNFWVIGDSGYPQLPYLMTPIQSSNLTGAQENYNIQHRKARNCIERCFGVLKSRFRCLNGERVLCYNPVTAGKIINSCIILHNILIENGVPDDELDEVTYNATDDDESVSDGNDEEETVGNMIRDEENGFQARNLLAQQYFSNL